MCVQYVHLALQSVRTSSNSACLPYLVMPCTGLWRQGLHAVLGHTKTQDTCLAAKVGLPCAGVCRAGAKATASAVD